MKNRKRILLLLLAAVMICCMSQPAFASDNLPDLNKKGSITVTLRDTESKSPVSGGTLKLYRVAAVKTDNGNYTFEYTKSFSDCPLPLGELQSKALAEDLSDFAAEKKLTGTEGRVSSAGTATFSDLELGLYLVVQDSAAEGYSAIAPFLVTVPMQEGSSLIYNVKASPKTSPADPGNDPGTEEDPDPGKTPGEEPGTTPGENPGKTPGNIPGETVPGQNGEKLPQTGQLWWPVPVFAAAGLVLFALGWMKRRRDENE